MESGLPETAADTQSTDVVDGPAAVVPGEVVQPECSAEQADETITSSPGAELRAAPEAAIDHVPVVEWSVLAMSGEQPRDISQAPEFVLDEAAPAEVPAAAPDAQAALPCSGVDDAEVPPFSHQLLDTCEISGEDAVEAARADDAFRASPLEHPEPDEVHVSAAPSETAGRAPADEIPRAFFHDDPVVSITEASVELEQQAAGAGHSRAIELPAASALESAKEVEVEAKAGIGLGDALAAPEEAEHPPVLPAPLAAEPWTEVARRAARRGLRYAAYGLAGYLALTIFLVFVYRFINPPMSTLMVYESIVGAGAEQEWVPIEKISPHLIRAVVVAEDGRFCDHNGIDLAAMRYAILRARNGIPAGASTISMQVTKNLFLWPSRSFIRKLIEIPLTLLMELIWPKSRILEVYLNIAEWAPGIFGAEAAAQHHFRKPAAALGEREAARLAAALPNPIVRDAGQPGPRLIRRAGMIQNRVRLSGDVTFCVR